MIQEFLEKYQNEILDEKMDSENKLHDLEIRLEETIRFIEVLESHRDLNREVLASFEINHPDREKILSLKNDRKKIKQEIEIVNEHLQFINNRFEEIKQLTNCSSKEELSLISTKLKSISQYVTQDPIRAKIEIDEVIDKIC